jgi:transcriptional regulator with XRE-family HTH domain
MPIRISFAQLCRDTRARLGLTQRQLADIVGVTRGYIAKIEHDQTNPSLDLVERIASALDLERSRSCTVAPTAGSISWPSTR